MAYALPRVWSLWIYDRHCNLIYHRDWSSAHFAAGAGSNQNASSQGASQEAPRSTGSSLLPGTSRSAPKGSSAQQAAQNAPGPSSSNSLPLDEEAKLVYGVVYSLRNMARKLGGPRESFNGYSTSSYTLSHLQTPTMYTFVLITDPPSSSSSSANRANSMDGSLRTSIGSTFSASGVGVAGLAGASSGGGGAGQTLQNVLLQIWKGPWIDFVARNPGIEALEREEREGYDRDDEEEDDEMSSDEEQEGEEDEGKQGKKKVAGEKEEGHVVGAGNVRLERRAGIDSDAFRDGVERVLALNKLHAPPTAV